MASAAHGTSLQMGAGSTAFVAPLLTQRPLHQSAPTQRWRPEAAPVSSGQGSAAAAAAAVAGAVAALGGRRQQGARRNANHGVTSRSGKLSAVSRPAVPSGGYCESAERCVRRKTRTINIGDVLVGSEHPVATQTMTTTFTHDVEATVAQIKLCADAGVDIVRITVQGMREAKACEHIKRRLLEDGYTTPIVADIHFTPKVALVCADFVDKVRVNPGNFADGRKSFDTIDELSEKDIEEAKAIIEESFAPLVLKLKEKNKALRIGVNHGSLAERILFQYGDSPEGMVASAIEFGEICRKYDYHNFLFSMKSSNPAVMVNAYRQLAREMYKLGWDYPLHLGVTEAGGGADGRIKSAVGIGALLLDGIGDTIRVSLTEDPEFEVKPCAALRRVAEMAEGKGVEPFEERGTRREGQFSRRDCNFPIDVPLNMDGSVLARATPSELESLDLQGLCDRFGLRLRKDGDVQKDWKSVDVVVVDGDISAAAATQLKLLLDVPLGVICRPGDNVPDGATLLHDAASVDGPLEQRVGGHALLFSGEESQDVVDKAIKSADPRLILLKPKSRDGVTFLGRRFFSMLSKSEETNKAPAMLWFNYPTSPGVDEDDLVMMASADFGSLFVDGMGEGILWDVEAMNFNDLREASFNLLQAARMRISKTEFISCPSCGRTLFNLQTTTAMIQERTGHLPGVRIAVMGCIVNGPGEMADADFGYVGSGIGKVDLYVKYDCVKRAIPSESAVDKLVELIKEHGRWQDPPSEDDDEVEAKELNAVATM
eukprot:CAMPEP_0170595968 /NCGR_PEP_ID=MMETSP0224-20130122/14851_1 /TAXON_ID=285029 /ORGANISM="Togula jolla, Strain CCCM 725" /LENGTH=769 /DNA_ID=CAMNT_0010920197 /DNA_START=50 /DNA_END=2359 /DNA_ORIENTATION=-